ncbi:unnamed protein product [Phytophthora lilii]|uniref:Unnamed protein product n=1 Tax=Phytophthora lilii TaxID=2077276 RepID=A0A9W7DDB4_9STRA|nr:unnamed protein product [Phytophthora lilii]
MALRKYKAVLVEFMSFNDTQKYSEDTEFSERSLLRITPEAICRWMNMNSFGELSPADDDKPLHARSATLEFAKKAISAFMPRKTVQWDPVRAEGNLTRSEAVNALIKRVKKFEVRREGVQSNARRLIEYEEFIRLLTLVRSQTEKDSVRI